MQPQSTASPLDLAWAAGYFDGEGCVSTSRANSHGHSSLRFFISAMSSQPESLDEMKRLFGGGIWPVRPKKRWKSYQLWALSGCKAQQALAAMQPYLRLKREQAKWALLFPPFGKGKGLVPECIKRQREMVRSALSILNQRGKIRPQTLPLAADTPVVD